MEEPKVSIIVLNWNNWEDTIECLESLFQINYGNYDVIMVDNGSEDDSINRIKDYANGKLKVKSDFFEYKYDNKPLKSFELEKDKIESIKSKNNNSNFKKNLFIMKNGRNYGFAEGNNIGIDFSLKVLKPDFILLLNNDIVVSKNFLIKLINVIKTNKNIAIVGPKNYYYDFYGRKNVETAMGGYINWLSYPGYHFLEDSVGTGGPIELDWVTGASMLIRADLPNIFLGKEFFFGAEDVDLCARVKEEGYDILLVPTSEIWHKISTSRYKKFDSYFKIFKNNFKSNFNLVKKHQRFYPLFFILYTLQMTFVYYPKKIINRERSK